MPLYRRLAHRGFSNHPFKKEWQIVNLVEIEKRFEESEAVNPASLFGKGLIKGSAPVKVLGNGELSKKLSFRVGAVSASAKEKIEKAGGDITLTAPAPRNQRGKSGEKRPE
jgi:large subunit ribosomal protein L15